LKSGDQPASGRHPVAPRRLNSAGSRPPRYRARRWPCRSARFAREFRSC
jgi:hypothetical protein